MADVFQQFQVDGHTVAAISHAPSRSGVPAVMLHGITMSLRFWEHTCPACIGQRLPWYSVSLPGHAPGALAVHTPASRITPELFSRHVAGALDALGLTRPVLLVGHSTGGFAAVSFAARHPERCAGVISIAGFGDGKWTGLLRMDQLMAAAGRLGRAYNWVQLRIVNRTARRLAWLSATAAADRRAYFGHPALMLAFEEMLRDIQAHDAHALNDLLARIRRFEIWDSLADADVPALIIGGGRDPIIPPAQAERLADALPRTTLAVLRGCGHMPFFERSAELNATIERWMRVQRFLN